MSNSDKFTDQNHDNADGVNTGASESVVADTEVLEAQAVNVEAQYTDASHSGEAPRWSKLWLVENLHLATPARKIAAATAAGIILLGGGAVALHEVIEHSVRHAVHSEFRHEHGDHHHGKGRDHHHHKHDERHDEERTQSEPRSGTPKPSPAPGQQVPSVPQGQSGDKGQSGDRAQSNADRAQSSSDQAQSAPKPVSTNQSGASGQARTNN